MKNPLRFFFLILLIPLLISGREPGTLTLRIAVSKASPNYINWLKKMHPGIETVDMSELAGTRVLPELKDCSGLLLTGGVDVHPGLYGKAEEAGRCEDIDTHRDSLEELLIRSAFDMKMPVLGVCRGEQMINVFLGGTLWIDIPTDYRNEAGKPDTSVHHQCADYLTCFHGVTLVKGTTLSGIIGNENGSVTSNHHQAVRQMAPALKCNARSADGLVEGVEWNNPAGKSFLIGIQWHPERMDTSSAFSGKLAREFIRQAASFILSRNKITK